MAAEGFALRKGLVLAGAATMVIGVAVFFVALVGASQAIAAFGNCLNNFPTYPMFGTPAECANAMASLSLFQGLEALGGVLGVVGFVLLIVGIVLQPGRPGVTPMYPPPVYAPPYPPPPQGPSPPPT